MDAFLRGQGKVLALKSACMWVFHSWGASLLLFQHVWGSSAQHNVVVSILLVQMTGNEENWQYTEVVKIYFCGLKLWHFHQKKMSKQVLNDEKRMCTNLVGY